MGFVSVFNLTQRRRGLAKVDIFRRYQVLGLWQRGSWRRLLRLRPASTQRSRRSCISNIDFDLNHASGSAYLLSAATAYLRVSDKSGSLNMNLQNIKVE